jgi:hypothetical protein
MRLKLFLVICLGLAGSAAILCLAPRASSAQGIVVSSGREGGYYNALGGRLRAVYIAERAEEIKHLSSTGSTENLDRLRDPSSPVNVALAQADALKRYVELFPEFEDKFTVLSEVGKECVFIIAGRNGDTQRAGDLKQKSAGAISVVSAESGAAITYDYMGRLEPGFRNTPAVHVDSMRALLQLRSSEFSELRALMLVQRPRTVSPPLEVVLDNLDVYRIVPIGREDLGSAKLPDGSEIYTFDTVRVGFGKDHSATFDTICTRGLLLASKSKLDVASLDDLAKVILTSASYIMPGRE